MLPHKNFVRQQQQQQHSATRCYKLLQPAPQVAHCGAFRHLVAHCGALLHCCSAFTAAAAAIAVHFEGRNGCSSSKLLQVAYFFRAAATATTITSVRWAARCRCGSAYSQSGCGSGDWRPDSDRPPVQHQSVSRRAPKSPAHVRRK